MAPLALERLRTLMPRLSVGLATFVPGVNQLLARRGTGGTCSARYCYAVWLRHLLMARDAVPDLPLRAVAELGPGDSLGIGLAALLCGAERYVGLDAVPYVQAGTNARILDELIVLLRARADIPGNDEFPELKPRIPAHGFPVALLPELDAALAPERIERIRWSLAHVNQPGSMIGYVAPWWDPARIEAGSLDLVYSQATLEHVDDLRHSYAALRTWLRPGGLMSHQIDFRSHGTAPEWNGHWTYPDWLWRLVRGNRPYLLNREPHSTHRRLIAEAGFTIVRDLPVTTRSTLGRRELAPRFRDLAEADLTTQGAFIQAVTAR